MTVTAESYRCRVSEPLNTIALCKEQFNAGTVYKKQQEKTETITHFEEELVISLPHYHCNLMGHQWVTPKKCTNNLDILTLKRNIESKRTPRFWTANLPPRRQACWPLNQQDIVTRSAQNNLIWMQYYILSCKYNKGRQDLGNWQGFIGEKKEVQFGAISLFPQLNDEKLPWRHQELNLQPSILQAVMLNSWANGTTALTWLKTILSECNAIFWVASSKKECEVSSHLMISISFNEKGKKHSLAPSSEPTCFHIVLIIYYLNVIYMCISLRYVH